jgi:beta-phosphoglucomutase-like phosphatase (HAD superfamily)
MLIRKDILHPKTAPVIYYNTLNIMCVEAENTIVLEDSKSGIITAKMTGMRVLCMLWQHVQQEFAWLDLFCIVSQLKELLEIDMFKMGKITEVNLYQ